ncbi:aspartate aminotransferase family protein [Bacillus sp. 2205SS5-2]|uniref:aspartate aminotransferase family protein n=1 Tax=Bacillus sp. 2205SS5-2 TaxID=3109031 RepID=UPI0030046DC3
MSRSYLIKPFLEKNYPMIDYGKGVYVYDKDGKEYLDACSGAVTANIGHGMEEIISKMSLQGNQIAFVYRAQFTNEPAENLAKLLADKAPSTPFSFFVNSGSEAVETAMKIALQYWQEKGKRGKKIILSRWLSYHGITMGALSLSGHSVRRERFEGVLEERPVLEPPYCYRCPFDLKHPSCQVKCAQQLDLMIERIGADNIAAFMAEPIIGAAGGAIVPVDEYYKEIKRICEKHNLLFIVDEVMTGCGRAGPFLAIEDWDVQPDIVAIGKGLSAGYSPIAATLVSETIMKEIQTGSKVVMSGHTYSANPLSASAALAVLELIDNENIMQEVPKKSKELHTYLYRLQKQFSFIGDVRGKGLLFGLEFIGGQDQRPLPSDCTANLIALAEKEGILLYPAGAGLDGKSGTAILIAPPLTITSGEMKELYERLYAVMDAFQTERMLATHKGD